MRLSDYKGEEALEVLADIIEPLADIFADPELQEIASGKGASAIKYAKPILKNHKREIIEVLARLENTPVDEYASTITLLTLPAKLLEFLNDPEVQALFPSQHQKEVKTSPAFGAATENTGAKKN